MMCTAATATPIPAKKSLYRGHLPPMNNGSEDDCGDTGSGKKGEGRMTETRKSPPLALSVGFYP